ncbi:hypothetical protein F9288_16830 [Sphingomonas sp. CL5.1]|uniref:hypothetical protein n=1 Tax=Sphingomonas sp. CL5.1 TaxID=2653203 RepID=UPI0015822512|nr:hypothetical protein [Sphingomonas sp. CL5.1]QKS01107.1 hypothetical protein F9288_16830 [Sphingomonas sp. CL5.1]
MGRLPAGFEDLEIFVDYWDVPTSNDRWNRRAGAEYKDIVRFYEAMTARMEEATAYVEQYPLDDMPDDVACLFRLLLALMQAAIAVELHQASRVPYSPWPHTLKIGSGLQPYG